MAKFLFVYHGGCRPEDMELWIDWFGGMGEDVVSGPNPCGKSKTILSSGKVSKAEVANPTTAFSIIRAKNEAEAIKRLQTCPVLAAGGTVEILEVFSH